MIIVPFEPGHLRTLSLQPSQAWLGPRLKPEYGASLLKAGPCFTALEGDEVLGCAGVMNMWEGRVMAWALISADAGKNFIRIFKAIKRFVDSHPADRIEATVDVNFEEGHRLMKMLGFEYEGLARKYLPDGRDVCLYARIR